LASNTQFSHSVCPQQIAVNLLDSHAFIVNSSITVKEAHRTEKSAGLVRLGYRIAWQGKINSGKSAAKTDEETWGQGSNSLF
jgi:hypothetical protein